MSAKFQREMRQLHGPEAEIFDQGEAFAARRLRAGPNPFQALGAIFVLIPLVIVMLVVATGGVALLGLFALIVRAMLKIVFG